MDKILAQRLRDEELGETHYVFYEIGEFNQPLLLLTGWQVRDLILLILTSMPVEEVQDMLNIIKRILREASEKERRAKA